MLTLNAHALYHLTLVSVQDLGGQGIVENSTIGLHRDVEFLQRLSNVTGVHIVAGTGTEHSISVTTDALCSRT